MWAMMGSMDWIRRNMTAIGIVVVFAMALPFLLVLFGIVAFGDQADDLQQHAKGDGRDLYLVTYEFDDGLVWTHRCQALHNGQDAIIRAEVYGDAAYAQINYWGRSFLRGGPQQFGGGPEK